MTLEELAQKVLDHALAHYNDGGWDVLVECYTVEDIVREWKQWSEERETNFDLPTTEVEAIKSWAVFVSIWDDRQADARNSAF